MIAGGAEMASTPLGIAGFVSSRALSTNDNPAEASRPWDKTEMALFVGWCWCTSS